MFYIRENDIVTDYEGTKVGFFNDGRFCQVRRKKGSPTEMCDKQYSSGLTPMQLEQISELLQTRKNPKNKKK